MSSLEHHGGSVKREAEATHGMGGASGLCVAWAGVPRPRVAWRHATKYLQ
jgi:hypothetical protein